MFLFYGFYLLELQQICLFYQQMFWHPLFYELNLLLYLTFRLDLKLCLRYCTFIALLLYFINIKTLRYLSIQILVDFLYQSVSYLIQFSIQLGSISPQIMLQKRLYFLLLIRCLIVLFIKRIVFGIITLLQHHLLSYQPSHFFLPPQYYLIS